jgi:hypothetical protein
MASDPIGLEQIAIRIREGQIRNWLGRLVIQGLQSGDRGSNPGTGPMNFKAKGKVGYFENPHCRPVPIYYFPIYKRAAALDDA